VKAVSVVYLFDDIRVHVAEFRVLKSGHVVALEPKAFEVLLHLFVDQLP
jgi:hypothetical protein